MKYLHILLSVIFSGACLFSQTVIPDWFEELPKSPPGIQYAVGYAGKYIDQSRAREAAIHQAVTSLAKQICSRLIFEIEEFSDGRFRLLNPSFQISYDNDDIITVFNNYSAIDSSITDEGYFILIAYPDVGRPGHAGNDKTWGAKPGWTIKLPRTKRYNYGVGIVANYSSWVRAWQDADEYARFDLGKNVKLDARSIHTAERDNTFIVESKIIRQSYDEEFRNTVIISRWYDKENDTYYSLCRQPRGDNR